MEFFGRERCFDRDGAVQKIALPWRPANRVRLVPPASSNDPGVLLGEGFRGVLECLATVAQI